jgi:competence protein ComEC
MEDAADLDLLRTARCSSDLCFADVGARRLRVLATRSPYLVDIKAMNSACAAADIAISDRRLPRSCQPRWIKLDRPLLNRTGGVAIVSGTREVRTVRRPDDDHPWIGGNR